MFKSSSPVSCRQLASKQSWRSPRQRSLACMPCPRQPSPDPSRARTTHSPPRYISPSTRQLQQQRQQRQWQLQLPGAMVPLLRPAGGVRCLLSCCTRRRCCRAATHTGQRSRTPPQWPLWLLLPQGGGRVHPPPLWQALQLPLRPLQHTAQQLPPPPLPLPPCQLPLWLAAA